MHRGVLREGVAFSVLEHGPSDAGERRGIRFRRYKDEQGKKLQKQRKAMVAQASLADQKESYVDAAVVDNIFEGVAVYFQGYTNEFGDYELKQMLLAHGGFVCHALKYSATTHIVCSNLATCKVDSMLRRFGGRFSVFIVKPEWVVRSVAAKKRLPEANFAVLSPAALMVYLSVDKLTLKQLAGGAKTVGQLLGAKVSFRIRNRESEKHVTTTAIETDKEEAIEMPSFDDRENQPNGVTLTEKKRLRKKVASMYEKQYHQQVGVLPGGKPMAGQSLHDVAIAKKKMKRARLKNRIQK